MHINPIVIVLLTAVGTANAADPVQDLATRTFSGLDVACSAAPYSGTISRIQIGWQNGSPKTGMAWREITTFETITGVVIVDKTENGYILREALFPDIGKIKNEKQRKQVLAILKNFKNIPFDPHAEKSAIDTISGASQHGHQITGYFNYMARHLALKMENPPTWAKPKP